MPIAFVNACKQYFGLKNGQKLTEFAAEVRELTDKDKAEMAPALSKALGDEVTVPPPAA